MASSLGSLDPSLTKILVVDDDPVVLSALKDQLQSEGFPLTAVETPMKALDELQRQSYAVILADEGLPTMSGLQLLAKVQESYSGITRVLLSSTLSLRELLEAMESGVIHRYVAKPWLCEELLAILKNAVAASLPTASADATEGGGVPEPSAPGGKEAELQPGQKDYTPAEAEIVVEAYVKMLGAFHPNFGSAAARTMAMCRTLSHVLQLPPSQARSLVWAGGLHDIGMISVERVVLRRWMRSPERCNEEDLAKVKKHPKESEQMLAEFPIFAQAGEIIRFHHENWDGGGYPDRIKGEAIPWLSRLLAPAIFFASKHSGNAQALTDLETQKDKMFDPKAIEAMSKAVPLTELPRAQLEIQLGELQPGMILARDVRSLGGMLIIAKGKELTTAWVNKLLTINSTTPLDPNVLVFC